jgi:beta-phosphoglucomutase-like phosphatase (HAD superfamily)
LSCIDAPLSCIDTAVLFDVDGTLVDVVANQKRVWAAWARRHNLDADHEQARER